MNEDVLGDLRKRISDPVELAKFERFAKAMARRLRKLGPGAGPAATIQETMICWRNVFGVEWPATKAQSARER